MKLDTFTSTSGIRYNGSCLELWSSREMTTHQPIFNCIRVGIKSQIGDQYDLRTAYENKDHEIIFQSYHEIWLGWLSSGILYIMWGSVCTYLSLLFELYQSTAGSFSSDCITLWQYKLFPICEKAIIFCRYKFTRSRCYTC